MKKIVSTIIVSTLLSTSYAQINLPQPSPAATTTQSIGLAKATIEYSRPVLKGRKMMGSELAQYNQVWRTGANKIPNLVLTDDMIIEGNKVPAGKYGIATIPTEGDWTIIITKNADQWGVYSYKESEDLVRFKVKSEKVAQKEEFFTMDFTDYTPTSAKVAIRWENVQVKFEIKQDADTKIMAQIKEKMAASDIKEATYSGAAEYYFQTNRDLKQAFEWANKVPQKDDQYWSYFLRAKIAAKMGNCAVAVEDATKGLAAAQKSKDGAYIVNYSNVLKDCEKK